MVPTTNFKNVEVLLVEDNLLIQRLHKDFFSALGMSPVIASTGKEALVKAKQHFDLIFLDLDLPDMNGVSVCKKIRQCKGHPNKETPIIILTAADPKLASVCYEVGASLFVSKPISLDNLHTIVMDWVNNTNTNDIVA